MKNYSKKQVLEAAEESDGVMEYVAEKLGCCWETAKRYVEKWEETKEAFTVAECRLHALAYRSFIDEVEKGTRWAVERVLDTTARRNGHGLIDRQKIDHSSKDGSLSPSVIQLVAPPKEISDEELKAKLSDLGIDC